MVTIPFLFMIQASPTFDIMRHFIAKDEENSIKHRKKGIKEISWIFQTPMVFINEVSRCQSAFLLLQP